MIYFAKAGEKFQFQLDVKYTDRQAERQIDSIILIWIQQITKYYFRY